MCDRIAQLIFAAVTRVQTLHTDILVLVTDLICGLFGTVVVALTTAICFVAAITGLKAHRTDHEPTQTQQQRKPTKPMYPSRNRHDCLHTSKYEQKNPLDTALHALAPLFSFT